jgi:hypothetical protein
MELIRRLGLRVIGKRLYTATRFAREGRETFSVLETAEGRRVLALYNEELKERIRLNQEVFTEMAYVVGLPSGRRLRILDLGSYNGMWPRVCARYGHQATCAEIPEVLARPEVSAMLDLLGVPSMPLRVMPMQSLAGLPQPLDLVTGFRTRFHSTKPEESGLAHETHWGVSEWDFFLRDLARNLTPNGRIFLMLNRLQEKEKGGGVPAALSRYFAERGGVLLGNFLRFDRLDGLR